MKPGIRYIVTKCSDDGTFYDGDHPWLLPDGSVVCVEAMGWVKPADVPKAMEGVEYEPDRAWAQRKFEEAERIAKEYA